MLVTLFAYKPDSVSVHKTCTGMVIYLEYLLPNTSCDSLDILCIVNNLR